MACVCMCVCLALEEPDMSSVDLEETKANYIFYCFNGDSVLCCEGHLSAFDDSFYSTHDVDVLVCNYRQN